MSERRPVVWSEGLLLTPQHFQQADRAMRHLVAQRFRMAHSFDWGLAHLSIDAEAIRNGRVVLTGASGVLPDGTPFPTSFYATCPKLTGALSTLEGQGVMREMSERLEHDEALRAAYAAAHVDYLERRAQLGDVPEVAGISAGGMPTRVKCLHVLVAHSLGAGPGVNPLGDEALAMLPQWWQRHPCSADAPGSAAAQGEASA